MLFSKFLWNLFVRSWTAHLNKTKETRRTSQPKGRQPLHILRWAITLIIRPVSCSGGKSRSLWFELGEGCCWKGRMSLTHLWLSYTLSNRLVTIQRGSQKSPHQQSLTPDALTDQREMTVTHTRFFSTVIHHTLGPSKWCRAFIRCGSDHGILYTLKKKIKRLVIPWASRPLLDLKIVWAFQLFTAGPGHRTRVLWHSLPTDWDYDFS